MLASAGGSDSDPEMWERKLAQLVPMFRAAYLDNDTGCGNATGGNTTGGGGVRFRSGAGRINITTRASGSGGTNRHDSSSSMRGSGGGAAVETEPGPAQEEEAAAAAAAAAGDRKSVEYGNIVS